MKKNYIETLNYYLKIANFFQWSLLILVRKMFFSKTHHFMTIFLNDSEFKP